MEPQSRSRQIEKLPELGDWIFGQSERASLKTKRPGLARPQSVGGDFQPLVVTVLTPATHRRWTHSTNNLSLVNPRKLANQLLSARSA